MLLHHWYNSKSHSFNKIVYSYQQNQLNHRIKCEEYYNTNYFSINIYQGTYVGIKNEC